jgi:hypothetical protein
MGTRTLLGRLRRPYRTEFVAAPREYVHHTPEERQALIASLFGAGAGAVPAERRLQD